MHRPVAEQGLYLRSVVAGHMRYYGVPRNGLRPKVFRLRITHLWHRTLRRRTQVRKMKRSRMAKLTAHWLPPIRICHPYPNQRLIVTTQGGSRMR